MVLYTIYPQETIFQVEETRNYLTVEVDNRVFVIELTDGQARIVRLISRSRDYLQPPLAAGDQTELHNPREMSVPASRNIKP